MSEQDYTILSNENLDIKVDDDQISGSNLFIQAKDLTAQSGVAGFEKFAPIKAFSESFRNNIRKDSKQKSASVGGTINSGFIEVYIPESIFSLELQKKGLSADPIPQITVMKTVLVKNTRTAVTQLFYTDCNIVYVASQLGTYYFMRFAFDHRTVKRVSIDDQGQKQGEFEFTYNVKESSVK